MVSLALVAYALSSSGVSDCGNGNSLFQMTNLNLDPPSTVMAGQNVSLSLLYNSPKVIANGTIKTSVTYNFIPFTPIVSNLCDSVNCPISVGQHDGSSSYPMPTGLSGSLKSQIVWYDDAGNQLLCIEMALKIQNKKRG
jgi:hypothetical protein